MLLGREAEQRVIDGLLHSARAGRSAVLVLRGEPGIGKTTLLDYARANADGMTVLSSVGIEGEHELPFAGLHQLLAPCLGLLDRLPAPQSAALRGAFGLAFEPVENPFLVSLGVLSLLGEACDERPVLCVIDDAHWLDQPSRAALTFAARRLEADPIAIVAAARTRERRGFEAPGLPELELHELDDASATALLTSRLDGRVAAEVVRLLLATAGGNPLALVELPAGLSADQLTGAEPIVGPPPARGAVEQAFRARVTALAAPGRTALLIVAADQGDEPHALERALERCGLSVSALDAARDAGLVAVDGGVAFRHPLVRSAVYGSATRRERHAVHEALAAVLEDPVRSAWHRALMTDGPDEAIAGELVAAGAQAVGRGAHATAATAFERAGELSEQGPLKGHRLLCAAQAAVAAGRSDAALSLAQRAEPLVRGELDQAELDVVRAMVSMRQSSPPDTFSLARRAAEALADHAPDRALEMVALMIWAAAHGGWASSGVIEAHRTLAKVRGDGVRMDFMRALLDAATTLLAGEAARARALFDEALACADRAASDLTVTRLAGLIGMWTARFDLARDRFARVVAHERAEGLLNDLAGTLPLVAISELCVGHVQASSDAAEEGKELLRQLGYEHDEISYLALHAWLSAMTGSEEECRQASAAAIQRGLATGIGWATGEAHFALGLLELGLGNAADAIEQFEQMDPGPFPPTTVLATPEFVDAALRLGETDRARYWVERFEAWTPVSGTALADGMLERCRAMMADDAQDSTSLFERALAHHDLRIAPFERAQTQLAYGERLRRDRQRVNARVQLRAAFDAFEGLGTTLWAQRADGELVATGETARKRDVSTLDDLTPQELRVARLVASGASNKEVAAQLFLSRRTVEYHLGKVFVKLGVGSRVELARVPLHP